MDAIYFEKPILLIIPILLLVFQVAVHIIFKKMNPSKDITALIGGIGAVLHAIGLTILMLGGGTLEDALVLVLVTGFVAIICCPKPSEDTEDNK